jgi:hypothetical protein
MCVHDAHGREWVIVEKAPVISTEALGAASSYPRPGIVDCEVIARNEGAVGQDVVVVDIALRWGIEATTGETRFEVRSDQLIGLCRET